MTKRAVIFKIPILDSHVLIFRRRGNYSIPNAPTLLHSPFDCFVFSILNRYELELALKRWL